MRNSASNLIHLGLINLITIERIDKYYLSMDSTNRNVHLAFLCLRYDTAIFARGIGYFPQLKEKCVQDFWRSRVFNKSSLDRYPKFVTHKV